MTPFATLDPPPVPDDLVDAVLARLRSALVAGGPLTWAGTGVAPPGQPLPYLVVGEPDEADSALDTGGDQLADGHLSLTAYGPTKKAARRAGDLAAAALSGAPPEFAAGTLVLLRQVGRSATLDPDPAPGGGDCWQEARTFHYLYSYPPPGGP